MKNNLLQQSYTTVEELFPNLLKPVLIAEPCLLLFQMRCGAHLPLPAKEQGQLDKRAK